MTEDWIDVSRWQGTIDWDQVKASGVQGAIIKAGGADGGLYTDSQFARNRDEARRVGLLRRTYWFEDPGVPAAEQAGYYLNLSAGIPPSIDLERGGLTTHDSALAVCTEVLAPGDWVYGSAYFLRDNLNGDIAFAKWALWIAGYPTYPFIPPPWHSEVAHQNTDARSVAGISGGVDSSTVYAAPPQEDDMTPAEVQAQIDASIGKAVTPLNYRLVEFVCAQELGRTAAGDDFDYQLQLMTSGTWENYIKAVHDSQEAQAFRQTGAPTLKPGTIAVASAAAPHGSVASHTHSITGSTGQPS